MRLTNIKKKLKNRSSGAELNLGPLKCNAKCGGSSNHDSKARLKKGFKMSLSYNKIVKKFHIYIL